MSEKIKQSNVASEPKQMTFNFQSERRKIEIRLAGTGTATIDWGDGTERKTYILSPDCRWERKRSYEYDDNYEMENYRAQVTTRTVTITGENIIVLDCSYNYLTKLDVSNNTALKELNCSYNLLKTLNISNNTALKELDCSDNLLKTLDVSTNTALTRLICSKNKLANIDVSANKRMEDMFCCWNKLKSLDVSANTALDELNCWKNQLTSLKIGKKNTKLKNLNCNKNRFTVNTLNDLFGMLPIGDGRIIDIGNNPETIGCDINIARKKGWQVHDSQNHLIAATEPNQMTIAFNKYPSWEIVDVVILMIAGSGMATIDWGDGKSKTLKLRKSFTTLRRSCGYSVISITGESITHLCCNGNKIRELDVSMNPALTWLDCSENQLRSLDVSKNTALTYLNCWANWLSSLDVSANLALTELECSFNELTIFDISKNIELTKLDCSYNELTSLDISNNSLLTKLYCRDNRMFADALNGLFVEDGKIEINVENNPGTTLCNLKKVECKRSSVVKVCMDRIKLEERLKYIEQKKNNEKCSGLIMNSDVFWLWTDYFCSLCGTSAKEEYSYGVIVEIRLIEIVVKKIKKLGYEVALDKSDYCTHCRGKDFKLFEKPELIFSIRYSGQSDYHVVRSSKIGDYECLLAFLEGKETYTVDWAESNYEHTLHESIDIIQKMTGLEADLD